jgi:hypothetical protein
MAVLKPRERLVYFRISEDEFHQFVGLCEKEGARSVSDLARSAVQRLIADGERQREEKELAPRIELLDKLIAEVKVQLEVIAAIQGRPFAADGNGDGQSQTLEIAAKQPSQKEEQSYGNPA